MLSAPIATAEGGKLAHKDKGVISKKKNHENNALKECVYINNIAPFRLNAFILCVAKKGVITSTSKKDEILIGNLQLKTI